MFRSTVLIVGYSNSWNIYSSRLTLFFWRPGSLVVNYPFDDDKDGLSHYSKSPDDAVFRQVAKAYSQVIESISG